MWVNDRACPPSRASSRDSKRRRGGNSTRGMGLNMHYPSNN